MFRIDWSTSGLTYWIDGARVATHTNAITGNMRPLVSDANTGGWTVAVDWLRLTPYAASGTFTSRIFDGGGPVYWIDGAWSAGLPAGTSLTISAPGSIPSKSTKCTARSTGCSVPARARPRFGSPSTWMNAVYLSLR